MSRQTTPYLGPALTSSLASTNWKLAASQLATVAVMFTEQLSTEFLASVMVAGILYNTYIFFYFKKKKW
jgi:hypothetical protein